MKTVESITDLPTDCPLTLSIGNYDGVHLGHLHVLDKLKRAAGANQSQTCVISFKNHPRELLNPEIQIPRLTTLRKKTTLLSDQQIDFLVLLPFTKEFANQTAEQFLTTLHDTITLQGLVLGHDASFGKDKGGDQETVKALAQSLAFTVEYASPLTLDNKPVSSSLIRELISLGEMEKAEKFLGRPYSLEGEVMQGQGVGKTLGFPTANIEVAGRCTPPYGVYAIDSDFGPGMANFGVAPTLKNQAHPVLEVHLFDHSEPLYGKYLEFDLLHFIRREKKFESKEELISQIKKDKEICMQLHKKTAP